MLKKTTVKILAAAMITLLAMLFTSTASQAKGKGKLKTVYNKVQDQTEISTGVEWLKKNKLGYDAGYSYPGQTPKRPEWVALRFRAVRALSLGDSVQWKNVATIYIRHDDVKLSYPVVYDAKVNNDTLVKGLFGTVVVETVTCVIPTNDFVSMSQSNEILFQIGDTSSNIAGGNLTNIADLGKSVPQ
jgi:hypothetical protein